MKFDPELEILGRDLFVEEKGKMRRRHRHNVALSQRPRKVSVFKEIDQTPQRFTGSLCPTNLQEQKEQFLKHGIVPKFKLKENCDAVEAITNKKRGQIKFDYLQEAKVVLERVKNKYGDGTRYQELAFGPRIDYISASEKLANYLSENNAEGDITVYWTPDLTCSARMMWHGPNMRYNRPEARKYSLIIKNSTENGLLRERGVLCLADHEIGTHFFRMVNDGFQPWFSDRKKFGLRNAKMRESVSAEEGFAALNTLLESHIRYLWGNALLYYTACMAAEMNFKDLYKHLETFVTDPEQRWKHVMRCKRGLADPNGLGGYGNDQCYFEGAVEILHDLEKIDFMVLYAGKVCVDEINRVRRLARMDCIRVPKFLRDIEKYKKTLRSIGYLNGIIVKVPRNVLSSTAKSNSSDQLKRSKSTGRRKLSEMHTPTPPPGKSGRHTAMTSRLHSSVTSGSSGEMMTPTPPPPRLYPAPPPYSNQTTYRTSPIDQIPGVTNQSHDFIYPASGAPPPFLVDAEYAFDDEEEAYEDYEEDEDDRISRKKDDREDSVVNEFRIASPQHAAPVGRLLARPKSEVNKLAEPTLPLPRKQTRVKRKFKPKSKKERVEYFGLLERHVEDD